MENKFLYKVFIAFASEDRYTIVEPIVYNLVNYGIDLWYDRYSLLMGDDRIEKNLIEGIRKCNYAVIIISENTIHSACAMEEISIAQIKQSKGEIVIFPVLYEISPDNIPLDLIWIKKFIFKEVNKHSNLREVCNHIACRITKDVLQPQKYQNIKDIIAKVSSWALPHTTYALLRSYIDIDSTNLNSKVTLLYSAYLLLSQSRSISQNSSTYMISKIFERLFTETKLNLEIDYRELWLLENSICILINYYLIS